LLYFASVRCQLGHGFRFTGLLPDADEFGLDLATLSCRDGMQHVAAFLDQTRLSRGIRKQFRGSREQPIMPIRYDQINLSRAPRSQVLQQADPSILAFLGTS